jgi:hypothetical protein
MHRSSLRLAIGITGTIAIIIIITITPITANYT